jgi:hypothetical protein
MFENGQFCPEKLNRDRLLEFFASLPNVDMLREIDDAGKVVVWIGDTHSGMDIGHQVLDEILEHSGFYENQNVILVFTGDFIDRGDGGLELLLRVLDLQSRFPDRVFVLKGNHETVPLQINNSFFIPALVKILYLDGIHIDEAKLKAGLSELGIDEERFSGCTPNNQLTLTAFIAEPPELTKVLDKITEATYLYVYGKDWIATHGFLGRPGAVDPFENASDITWLDIGGKPAPDEDALASQLADFRKRVFIRGHLLHKSALEPICFAPQNKLIFTQHTMCAIFSSETGSQLLLPTIVRKRGDDFRLEIVPGIIERTFRVRSDNPALVLPEQLRDIIEIFNELPLEQQKVNFGLVRSAVSDFTLNFTVNDQYIDSLMDMKRHLITQEAGQKRGYEGDDNECGRSDKRTRCSFWKDKGNKTDPSEVDTEALCQS